MARILEIGGTNAVIAALLAIVVWAITRHGRQPAFAHLLWVLVLVKLITPPLLPIPWWVASDVSMADQLVTAADEVLPQMDLDQSIATKNASARMVEATSGGVAATSPPQVSPFVDVPWTTCLGGLWLTGSAIWLAIAVGRLARFHFALSDASLPSDELQRLADDVAAKLGVPRYRVRVTSGRLSPMVWPVGRPTIVVPQNLLDILSEPELRAILTHEFAHLRRKDHWVRWLEFVVTAIYWWHPVVWYVRRKTQQAEEWACDAWVVQSNPAAAKEYASALFQAVQFATETLRPAPVLASRVTSGGDLKERIENVLNAKWNAEMSKRSRKGLWILALCILPWSLTSVYANDAETAKPGENVTAVPAQVVLPLDQRNPPTHVQERQIVEPDLSEAAVLRDQVDFLDQQFKRTDALLKTGAPGGTADRWSLTGFELAKARGELALAEGNREAAIARFTEAEEFAGTSLKATSAAYHADRVTLDSLMQASKNLTDIRRRLIQVRRGKEAATSAVAIAKAESSFQRDVAQASSSDSNAPSLAILRKFNAKQKMMLDRLQSLADKHVVSASELEQAKTEFEVGLASVRQAERMLESRRLLVQLAEVEYAQAMEANKNAPGAVSELEVRRRQLMVELAKSKVREIGD
jgi:beta-lactamase regulating signal transducer with metallopeptidase domain